MRGTLVCAVTEDENETADALALGAELSERLGLRLIVAHAVDCMAARGPGHRDESVAIRADRQGAERRLARLAAEHGVAHRAEKRVAVGESAASLGRIAAEEAADVIVVGGKPAFKTETPVPVLLAPPRKRGRRRAATVNGRPR